MDTKILGCSSFLYKKMTVFACSLYLHVDTAGYAYTSFIGIQHNDGVWQIQVLLLGTFLGFFFLEYFLSVAG